MNYRLADHSQVLSTRIRGEHMRAELLEIINAAPNEVVVVDLEGVLSASYSFVDEFFGKLAESMGDTFPELVNVPPAVARTIERSFRRRGVAEGKPIAALLQPA